MRSENYLSLYFPSFVQHICSEKKQEKSSGKQCVSEASKSILKRFIQLSLLALFFLTQPAITQACELEFSISEEKKEVYKIGHRPIVEIMVVYTLQICESQLSDTKNVFQSFDQISPRF
jgi:hypothetical protein